MRVVTGLDQDGDAWHAWRAGGIGGSDVAAVLGLNPFTTRAALLGERASGRRRSLDGNPHVARGKRWEPYVRDHYQRLTGYAVAPACVAHDAVPWARVSLDGIRDDHRVVLEVKCPTARGCDRIRRDGPRAYHVAQCQYQLWVTGAAVCHLVVFDADTPGAGADPPAGRWQLFEVWPDPDFWTVMVPELGRFWDEAAAVTPPPPGDGGPG